MVQAAQSSGNNSHNNNSSVVLQGIQVTPKFVFGVDGQLNNSLHLHDERCLIYVAGHNIIVYNL